MKPELKKDSSESLNQIHQSKKCLPFITALCKILGQVQQKYFIFPFKYLFKSITIEYCNATSVP